MRKKDARPHFPADDIGPLVDENRQVAIGLHPLRIARADDCFRSWPNDQRLGQRTGRHHLAVRRRPPAVMRHDGAFLGEAFDVLRFFREIAQRNEKREVGVLVPGRLEHGVELALHVFPDAVAPRLDHHAAAHVGRFGQLGRADDLLIPFGKIFLAPRGDRGLRLFWFVRPSEAETCTRAKRNRQPAFRCEPTDASCARRAMFAQRIPCFAKAAGKIDAADAAITRVRAASGARHVKCRIENVLAMFSSAQSVIDDQREHDVARARLSVGNIFTPTSHPIYRSDSSDQRASP